MTTRVDRRAKVGEIIQAVQVGMLTTVQDNGELRSRPMLCAGCDFDSLWFLAAASEALTQEAINRRAVNVSFADPGRQLYASVTGSAEFVQDEQMVQKLWRPELKSWFPSGPEERGLVVLRLDIHHAEAWENDRQVG